MDLLKHSLDVVKNYDNEITEYKQENKTFIVQELYTPSASHRYFVIRCGRMYKKFTYIVDCGFIQFMSKDELLDAHKTWDMLTCQECNLT